MIYTPNDIKWIKHITNPAGGSAYMEPADEFTLHVPTSSMNNAAAPAIGEIIILYQNFDEVSYFTHLVTPIHTGIVDEIGRPNYRPQYRYGRRVKVIAMTTIENSIPRMGTGWQGITFRGVSQGNICEVSHISNITSLDDLKLEMWNLFSPYFSTSDQQSLTINGSLIDELELDQNRISVEEGRSKLIQHLIRERNRAIITAKKNEAIINNTLRCEVCEFSFREQYQVDFIECHHVDPIGTGVIRQTTVDTLALVCPNCHRMLHRKFGDRFLSVAELKAKFH